ncbi:MAG: DUF1315 family protein [Halioglobus sp.]
MDYQQAIDKMSPEIYENLKKALEQGRWPDGRPMTSQQREHALAAVIAWGELHLPEHERVGFIDRGKKTGAFEAQTRETPLTWKDRDEH